MQLKRYINLITILCEGIVCVCLRAWGQSTLKGSRWVTTLGISLSSLSHYGKDWLKIRHLLLFKSFTVLDFNIKWDL